ncbi:hypothetical protein C8F01DRAFT_1263326 [Mycena amicta]|nr:hypothetical protein C8F01DRAFT_1263326 [Mycena amicta]
MASRHQKRNRAQANTFTTPVENLSMADIFGGPQVLAMTTYVEQISNDKKRRYQEAIPVNPPSPMKNQKAAASTSTANSVFSLTEEVYTMELDGWEGYGEDDPSHAGSTASKDRTAAVKPSDPALHYWLENHRDDYLQLFLWHDGRGPMDSDTCPDCAVAENAVISRFTE